MGKEYIEISPMVYCPLGVGFYRWRWQDNIRDILGQQWWLRLLLPTKGGIVDLRPGIAPRPSPAGAAALMQRMSEVAREDDTTDAHSSQDWHTNSENPRD